jgi:hypothetical protein
MISNNDAYKFPMNFMKSLGKSLGLCCTHLYIHKSTQKLVINKKSIYPYH